MLTRAGKTLRRTDRPEPRINLTNTFKKPCFSVQINTRSAWRHSSSCKAIWNKWSHLQRHVCRWVLLRQRSIWVENTRSLKFLSVGVSCEWCHGSLTCATLCVQGAESWWCLKGECMHASICPSVWVGWLFVFLYQCISCAKDCTPCLQNTWLIWLRQVWLRKINTVSRGKAILPANLTRDLRTFMMSWRVLCLTLLVLFLAASLQHVNVDPVGFLKRLSLEASLTSGRDKLHYRKHCWYHSKAYYKALVFLSLVPVHGA